MAFCDEIKVPCHGTTEINVVYTNKAESVDAWVEKVEGMLAVAKTKIAGVDVEYTSCRGSYFHPQKVVVLQLCVGVECLVYHACHADKDSDRLRSFLDNWHYRFAGFDITQDRIVMGRSGFYLSPCSFKDIQSIWRDPDNEKPRSKKQGLKDVAAAVIDEYYRKMKDGFGQKEHEMWKNSPLPSLHIEYAARDAYAAYEI